MHRNDKYKVHGVVTTKQDRKTGSKRVPDILAGSA